MFKTVYTEHVLSDYFNNYIIIHKKVTTEFVGLELRDKEPNYFNTSLVRPYTYLTLSEISINNAICMLFS